MNKEQIQIWAELFIEDRKPVVSLVELLVDFGMMVNNKEMSFEDERNLTEEIIKGDKVKFHYENKHCTGEVDFIIDWDKDSKYIVQLPDSNYKTVFKRNQIWK